MGFTIASAASSCATPSFFSASCRDLSELSAAIASLICSGGSVNFLVCGSMPNMIIVIFVDTSRNVVIGGHEALNMFLGELNLLKLLCSGRAGIKQSESQER